MKYNQRWATRLLAVAATMVAALSMADRGMAVTVGPGAFSYSYNSQNATGTGAADPNAVLNNILFSGDGGVPNNPPFYVNFLVVDQFVNGPADGLSFGDVTYTFDAAPGEVFAGNASVTDRINVFNFNGNIRGEFSTDGGSSFSDFTQRGTGDPEFATNSLNVDGASSVVVRYNLANIRNQNQRDQVQFLRQANVNLQGLEPAPFVFSGETRAIPEPASLALLGLGGIAWVTMARRRRA